MKKGTERIHKGKGFTVFHQNIPKKQLRKHRHQEAHLFIPLEGQLELEVEGTVYRVSSGKMMFIPGNIDHSFTTHTEAGERIILQFEESQNKSFKKFKGAPTLLPTHPLIKELILSLFPYEQSGFVTSLEDLILEILREVLQSQNVDSKNVLFTTQQKILASQDPAFKKIITLMQQDLTLSLEDIAEKGALSKRSLTRLLQAETGLSPKELYTYFRIQRATEMIFEGRLGLTAIAFECGYNSLSQFIENFKRWTGMKPSEFRPSH